MKLKIRDGWESKYTVRKHGSVGSVWAVYSNRWHSVKPRKKISPWFSFKFEAEEWIRSKWKIHVDRKLENLLLGRE